MIRLTNVSRTVRSGSDDLTILYRLDLEVPRGQFLAVTGSSGSGKSTRSSWEVLTRKPLGILREE